MCCRFPASFFFSGVLLLRFLPLLFLLPPLARSASFASRSSSILFHRSLHMLSFILYIYILHIYRTIYFSVYLISHVPYLFLRGPCPQKCEIAHKICGNMSTWIVAICNCCSSLKPECNSLSILLFIVAWHENLNESCVERQAGRFF